MKRLGILATAGVDLLAARPVGVGTVCRRQRTGEIERILSALAGRGLALHGFGVKTEGLRAGAQWLVSADSMSWSYRGRRVPAECGGSHRSEANCYAYAAAWRERVLRSCESPQLAFQEVG